MRILVPLLALSQVIACHRGEVRVTPESGRLSGYEPLRVDLSGVGVDPDEVDAAFIGGVEAYDLVSDGEALELWSQGAPEPGRADLVLVVAGDELVYEGVFEFEPAVDPLFDRLFAMGASLTQGVQGGVPTRSAQLHSPGRYLAVQSGAYYALPLLVEGLFPTIDAEDIGPAPGCAVPNVVDFVASAAVDVLAQINDVENDRLDFARARVTPDLEPRNVAVGGSKVSVVLQGPGDDFATGFLAKLVYDVHADIGDPVETSQVDLVEAGEPTLVILTDVYGNDLITAIVDGDSIDPGRLTPPDELRASLEQLLARLAGTGAEVFVANMPRATLLPATDEKVRAAVDAARRQAELTGGDVDAAGAAEEARLAVLVDQVAAAGIEYNAILAEVAADHSSVHVVDFAGRVEQVAAEGLVVGDEDLSILKLGGLLSTDGVHFSDAGYAMVANLFLDTIEAELGVAAPRVDLGPIVADDPFSPANLRAAGLDPDACDPR